MAKSRIKKWLERHAAIIVTRFALTIFWPMAFLSLAMLALVVLIVLIAVIPDAAPVA